jgi:CheY-like chemotaxis protein
MNKSIATPSAHLTAGDYVVLEIRDHGTGISPEALHHVFDPYFTTKDNGSGLGLSISHSIITQHGGHIDVSSKPGEGTLFTIYLPAVKNIPPHVALPCEDIPGLSGRVLVLDDEQMILDLVENMLSAMGLESVCVSTGDEAVREYRAAFDAGNPFDIVIMDLTIPGDGGGKEAIHILREFDPKVRAIVSSGYSESSILSDQLKKTIASVLRAC